MVSAGAIMSALLKTHTSQSKESTLQVKTKLFFMWTRGNVTWEICCDLPMRNQKWCSGYRPEFFSFFFTRGGKMLAEWNIIITVLFQWMTCVLGTIPQWPSVNCDVLYWVPCSLQSAVGSLFFTDILCVVSHFNSRLQLLCFCCGFQASRASCGLVSP